MDWIKGLQRAIDYMEEHIEDDIDYVKIARQAYSSSFHFQRIFHIICGYSIGEYIRNRRLSLAEHLLNFIELHQCRQREKMPVLNLFPNFL